MKLANLNQLQKYKFINTNIIETKLGALGRTYIPEQKLVFKIAHYIY